MLYIYIFYYYYYYYLLGIHLIPCRGVSAQQCQEKERTKEGEERRKMDRGREPNIKKEQVSFKYSSIETIFTKENDTYLKNSEP